MIKKKGVAGFVKCKGLISLFENKGGNSLHSRLQKNACNKTKPLYLHFIYGAS